MRKKKILVGGAGGAPSEGVIKSLLLLNEEEIIGMGSVPSDLAMSSASKRYLVPFSNAPEYKDALLRILKTEQPHLLHAQNDLEVFHISKIRDDVEECGTKLFMPAHRVIDTCVDKWKTWLAFSKAGLRVPNNILINDRRDLRRAFSELGDEKGTIWLRYSSIGGGGVGSIPTNNYEMGKAWIDRFDGWGSFVAAEMLTPQTITWMSLWYQGELVVAQTRKRSGWVHGNRSASGVTGVTKVGETVSDETVTKVAIDSIYAVDDAPHGLYGVDMAFDKHGFPNPTEINISRFFTTILFFTHAGLNMPGIYKNLALYGMSPTNMKAVNPLPDGLLWLRGMDTEPMLTTKQAMEERFLCL